MTSTTLQANRVKTITSPAKGLAAPSPARQSSPVVPDSKVMVPQSVKSVVQRPVDDFMAAVPLTASRRSSTASALTRAVPFAAQAPVTMQNVLLYLSTGTGADPYVGVTQRFALDRLELTLPDNIKRSFLDDISSVMTDQLFDSDKFQFMSEAAYFVHDPTGNPYATVKFPPGSQNVLRQAFLNLETRTKQEAPGVWTDFSASFRGENFIELDPSLSNLHEIGYRPWARSDTTPIGPIPEGPNGSPEEEEPWSPSNILDGVQIVLDIAGFVPGVGELADATNAGVSIARGDYIGAALSAVSLLPIAGDAIGKGAKYLLKSAETPAGLKAARGAAEKFMELVGKTDFASFYESAQKAFAKVPQLAGKVDEAVVSVGRGLQEVIADIGKKFGIPVPNLATAGGGGLNGPPRPPAGQRAGSELLIEARKAALAAFVAKGVTKASPVFAELAAKADPKFVRIFRESAEKSKHVLDHVLQGSGAQKADQLGLEFRNRFNQFSLFESPKAAENAAVAVLDVIQSKGVNLFAGKGLPDAIRALKNGEETIIDGIKYGRDLKKGTLSATVRFNVETGSDLLLRNGKDISQQACNAVTVALNIVGDGLVTVFPKIF